MNMISTLPKSQAALSRALMDLLEIKPFTSVTVKDITTHSGLGRSTFYLYYNNKEDLLDKLETILIEGFMAQLHKVRRQGPAELRARVTEGTVPGFVQYFAYLRANREEFTLLVEPQEGVHLREKWLAAIWSLDLERYSIAFQLGNPAALARYRSVMFPHYLGIFVDWIKGGMVVSDQAMARVLSSFWKVYVFQEKEVLLRTLAEMGSEAREEIRPAPAN